MALDDSHGVRDFFQHLLQLKKEGALDNLPVYFQSGALRVLTLKQVHRELCEATEGLRDATSEAKTQLDQSSLQLQNLLYEQQHYEKEIGSCMAYQSAYPDEELELIPEDEFQAVWQAQHGAPAIADPHMRMLNRLSHELASREETVKQLVAVKVKRDALAADVAHKRSVLGALEGEVAKLRSAAQSVQQQFSIMPLATTDSTRLAAMLPQPLYVLYTQLKAATQQLPGAAAASSGGSSSSHVDVDVTVSDGGDPTVAQYLTAMHRSTSTPNAPLLSTTPKTADGQEVHPLSLTLSLQKPSSTAPALAVTFRLLPALNLVTVAGARPEQDALLAALFPADNGTQLPTPSTSAVDVQQLPGRPYRWAQHAAGIDILPPLPPQLYTGAAAASGGELAAAAAFQRFTAERRAAAVLEKLKEGVLRLK